LVQNVDVEQAKLAAFGDRLPVAERYASILASKGIEWGLLGPSEADRIWERHILNSVALAELIPASVSRETFVDGYAGLGVVADPPLEDVSREAFIDGHAGTDVVTDLPSGDVSRETSVGGQTGSDGPVEQTSGDVSRETSVIDVGSGAGLPGIPLAIARPDLHVTLLEPLLRRATFLAETPVELDLDNVTVVRARAEDHRVAYDYVVCRAVAPLDKLLKWCMPLLNRGGTLLALKGESAHQELVDCATLLAKRRLAAKVEKLDWATAIRVSIES
jgi:16S rRNA (guanine(527)-N(7))-methyltransferase RsmG